MSIIFLPIFFFIKLHKMGKDVNDILLLHFVIFIQVYVESCVKRCSKRMFYLQPTGQWILNCARSVGVVIALIDYSCEYHWCHVK